MLSHIARFLSFQTLIFYCMYLLHFSNHPLWISGLFFYGLVIVKTNVMNMRMPIPLWGSDFSSFGKIPKSDMARSYSIFNFLITFHAVFPFKLNNFAFPSIVYKGYIFSISSVTLVIFCLVDKSLPNNRLVPNWERSTSRLYIVILLI